MIDILVWYMFSNRQIVYQNVLTLFWIAKYYHTEVGCSINYKLTRINPLTIQVYLLPTLFPKTFSVRKWILSRVGYNQYEPLVRLGYRYWCPNDNIDSSPSWLYCDVLCRRLHKNFVSSCLLWVDDKIKINTFNKFRGT